ncbi:hypothetical protein [Mycobacterium servetii]|uniref:Uncharacterized protein n=1 Tax=Mycobacterium servetii TaxID=3237418 RepID=A0ABV4BYC9_9MYCO
MTPPWAPGRGGEGSCPRRGGSGPGTEKAPRMENYLKDAEELLAKRL